MLFQELAALGAGGHKIIDYSKKLAQNFSVTEFLSSVEESSHMTIDHTYAHT